MKFNFDSLTFVFAILSALVADSSIAWCIVFAVIATSSFLMQRFFDNYRIEKIKSEAIKKAHLDNVGNYQGANLSASEFADVIVNI